MVAVLPAQAVMLLSALGIPDDVFVELQCSYLNSLSVLCEDEEVAFRFLQTHEKASSRQWMPL